MTDMVATELGQKAREIVNAFRGAQTSRAVDEAVAEYQEHRAVVLAAGYELEIIGDWLYICPRGHATVHWLGKLNR